MDSRTDHLGTYDPDFVEINTNNQYHLKENFMFEGTQESIDTGYLDKVEIDTTEFDTISSIEAVEEG
jgi:cyclopropane fatty-acyl-phospholipid synthase-like methyltransferase